MNGSLKVKSLPRLLAELWQKKSTGALKLQRRLVEKTIILRQGQINQVDSNILADTLAAFLVRTQLLDETKAQEVIQQSQSSSRRLGEILLERDLIDPTALYQAMQKLLVAKVVDCFLWDDGHFEWHENQSAAVNQIEMNMDPFHVLVQGVQTSMPFERMRADISLILNKPVRVAQAELPSWSQGYLNATSLKLLKAFHEPKKPRFVMEELAIAEEAMLRIFYIFDVTGLILNTEAPLSATAAVKPTALAAVPDPNTTATPPADPAVVQELLSLTLKLDKLTHFELLGIDFDTTVVGMNQAYLKFIERFSPHQFATGPNAAYRRQNENLLLAAAEAYADMRDVESKVRYNDKLKAKKLREENDQKKNPGATFKIQTDLLDARTQFEQGLKHLEQRTFPSAVKYFEYACDIDGRQALYTAYLAWAKHLQWDGPNQPTDDKEVVALFEAAIQEGGENAKVNMLYGKFLMGRPATQKKGLHHLKRATQLSPKDLEIERTYRLAASQN